MCGVTFDTDLCPCCAHFVLLPVHMDWTFPLHLWVPLENIELQGAFLLVSDSGKGEDGGEELY